MKGLLPTANEVWASNIFTGVCLSGGGVIREGVWSLGGGVVVWSWGDVVLEGGCDPWGDQKSGFFNVRTLR